MPDTDDRPAPSEERIRAALHTAAARRRHAETEREHALATIAEWARAAVDVGMERQEVAALAGVSRQTLYLMLRRDGGNGDNDER